MPAAAGTAGGCARIVPREWHAFQPRCPTLSMKMPGKLCAAEAYSARPDTEGAAQEAVSKLSFELGGSPDLVLAFYTEHHLEQAHRIARQVRGLLAPDAFAGACTPGVIGGGHEHPHGPGLSLWGARLPGARVQAFDLQVSKQGNRGYVRGWPDVGADASVLMFVDQAGFPLDPFLHSLRKGGRYPAILGGMVPTGEEGEARLLVDGVAHDEGAVGIVMDGAARLEPVVAQGCWPVGPAFHITRAERNIIFELDGAPAYDRLTDLLDALPDEESERFRTAPQVGLKQDDVQEESGAGSYLVRDIVTLLTNERALAVGEPVEEGMQLRFHAKDALAAHRELESMLRLTSAFHPKPAGALLFTCAGRGRPLFGHPDHDVSLLETYWPDMPTSGFFAAGEIGPLGGQPQIHTFTASLGLLVPSKG